MFTRRGVTAFNAGGSRVSLQLDNFCVLRTFHGQSFHFTLERATETRESPGGMQRAPSQSFFCAELPTPPRCGTRREGAKTVPELCLRSRGMQISFNNEIRQFSVIFARAMTSRDSEIIQYAQLCDTTRQHDAGHAAIPRLRATHFSAIACSKTSTISS